MERSSKDADKGVKIMKFREVLQITPLDGTGGISALKDER